MSHQPVTDMIGQPVKVGSRVVTHGTKTLDTGRVVHVSPLFCSVQSDDGSKWRRIRPWHLVVFGVEVRGKLELVA